jgi:hypothetical protein
VTELVPPNVELPATVFTVKRTDPIVLRSPDFDTVHRPVPAAVVQDDVPEAPLLHVPETS